MVMRWRLVLMVDGCCAEEDGCILGLENEQLKAKADKYGYRFHAPVTMHFET